MAKEKNKTELPQVVEGELQARLIKLREDAGFDISQMADALCLSEDVIVNLENEAFDLLPEPPYVRGYLRNYAKLSNDDDATELITRYESLRGADASELDFQINTKNNIANAPKKRLSPVWGQLILLGILVGAIGLIASIPSVNSWLGKTWQSFSSQLGPTDASDNPSLLGNLPVPAPLPEEEIAKPEANEATIDNKTAAATTESTPNSTETTSEKASGESETATNATTESTSTTATTETTTAETDTASQTTESQTTTENTETSDTQEIAAASLDGTINIKLVFNKEVWLRIKDKDNKTVFEGLNKADTEKTIDLKKPLTFRVGNAQGLGLIIDDKAVDITSYINGSIANFTLE